MNNSGFKMKGFTYPGKSPLKQTKFPNSPKAIERKENKKKKVITPKKEEEEDNSFLSPSDNTKVDKDQFAPEVSISSTRRRSMKDTKANETYYGDSYANRIKSGLTHAGMSKRDLKKMRTKKVVVVEKSEKKKEENARKSIWDNNLIRDLAVGTTLAMITKKKEEFVPVDVAGKQHKIM